MYQLLRLIQRYRAFLTFLFIEFICLWFLVRNSAFHSAAYFHTSNVLTARILSVKHGVVQYFGLPAANEQLAYDNARLRELLSKQQLPVVVSTRLDSMLLAQPTYHFNFLAAKVINNSTRLTHNHLTINKGKVNGVIPGMGVIAPNGVVGKVKAVSDHFATISSLLNTEVFVSAYIKRNNVFCSINWDGKDILKAKMLYVPRHIELQQGDTILTSGYNSVFPENILIGTISEFSLAQNATFYEADIELSNDFSRISYVYVIKNPYREERHALESELFGINE